MKNAVIYPRYSSQGQNEQSIEGQIRICTEFAESNGYNIVGIYPDKAKTGTNDSRPAFQSVCAMGLTQALQTVRFAAVISCTAINCAKSLPRALADGTKI